jgi:hypothetical protein
LKIGFITETPFPAKKGGKLPVKDEIFSLLPDRPCCDDEEFHKESMGALVFGLFYHGMKRQIVVPEDA